MIVTPLGAEDARILALERGPIRGHTLKILLVEDAPAVPPVDELRVAMASRLPELERWTQRLVPAPETSSGLAWATDAGFDLGRHVRLRTGDAPVDEDALRGIVAELMTEPLDRDHPLWTLDVVPRLQDGRWALVWKIHHCLADGMAVMRAGPRLLWEDASARAETPAPRPPSRPGAPAQAAAGARLARVVGHRGLVLREFRRVHELSPLGGDVGSGRTVAFTRCTLEEMRRIGHALSPPATVNDVLLAAVAGSLRSWLAARGDTSAALKAQVPVSMHPHPGTDAASGNRDSFLFVKLPVAEPDPVARLRAVTAATVLRKNRHDAQAINALRESLSHAPARVRRTLQHVVQGPHEYSLNISNVPGPAGPISVLGHHVDELYSLAEVAPHHGLRVSAVSLEGCLFIGLCADPRLVPALDELAYGIRSSLDELHERLGTTPSS